MDETYQIFPVDDSTWRIEDGFVRIFLLAGSEKALLIDTGMTLKNAREIAERLTGLPLMLLNTHGDIDHIGGNGAFPSFYMSPAEEPNYRSFGGQGTILPVHGGDVLDLGNRPLEIVDLPGHTPGSIGVLDVNHRVLISGDPIQDGVVFMFGPGRDLTTYLETLERLDACLGRFDEIWPAHGTWPLSPARIDIMKAGARKVLAGEGESRPRELYGLSLQIRSAEGARFLMER